MSIIVFILSIVNQVIAPLAKKIINMIKPLIKAFHSLTLPLTVLYTKEDISK